MSVCQGCGSPIPASRGPRPRKWCTDRCRKVTLYSRSCLDCGAPLNGSDGNGPNAPTRCVACGCKASGAERKVWTREALIHAIQRWAREFGIPPTVSNWDPQVAERLGHPEMCPGGEEWPHPHTVRREFGSWAAGLRAAGFTPRAPHHVVGVRGATPERTAA